MKTFSCLHAATREAFAVVTGVREAGRETVRQVGLLLWRPQKQAEVIGDVYQPMPQSSMRKRAVGTGRGFRGLMGSWPCVS